MSKVSRKIWAPPMTAISSTARRSASPRAHLLYAVMHNRRARECRKRPSRASGRPSVRSAIATLPARTVKRSSPPIRRGVPLGLELHARDQQPVRNVQGVAEDMGSPDDGDLVDGASERISRAHLLYAVMHNRRA